MLAFAGLVSFTGNQTQYVSLMCVGVSKSQCYSQKSKKKALAADLPQ